MNTLEEYIEKEKKKRAEERQLEQNENLKLYSELAQFMKDYNELYNNVIRKTIDTAINTIKKSSFANAYYKQQVMKKSYGGNFATMSIYSEGITIQLDIAVDENAKEVVFYCNTEIEALQDKVKAFEERVSALNIITKEFIDKKIIGLFELINY